MKFPWPLRYTLPGIIFLFGALLSTSTFLYDRAEANHQVEMLITRHVQFIGNQISGVAAHFLADDDTSGLQGQISALGADPAVRTAVLCDEELNVLTSSRYELSGEPLAQTPLAYAAAEIHRSKNVGTVFGIDGRTLLGIFPFLLPPKPGELISSRTGYLLLECELEYPKTQVMKALIQRSTLFSGALALACFLAWIFFHRFVNRRIGGLVEVTEKLAAGEPATSAKLSGSDEIARLSHAFDAMAAKISLTNAGLRDANERMKQEISERAFIEEALRNSERRFRSIWESSLDPMRLTDAKGSVFAVNEAYSRLMERSAQELIGRPFTDAYAGPEHESRLVEYQQQFEGRTLERFQVKRVALPSGRALHLEVSYSFVELERDRPLVLAILRDVTEHIGIVEKLNEAKEFSENLIATANVMIVALDENQRVTIFNRAAEQVSGFSADEVRQRAWSELIRRDGAPAPASEGGRQIFEARFATRAGDERLISWQTNPIFRNGRPSGTICFGVDVTERARQEEQRLSLERKLLDSQKLESLGVLAGGIAHDFNNLLAAILGNTNLAQMQLPKGSAAAGYLGNVEKSSLRAADLCRQMLAYSGKGRFAMHAVDLNNVVRETLELLEVSITKKASLRVELRPGVPNVFADPAQIQQVIMNLVINASEAMGETSGLIRIRTGLVQADSTYFEKACAGSELPPGEYNFVEVSDTGCGMSPETQARIFEPFYTTKFTGRGLGLAAVLGIVRGHEGALKITSEVGHGSTFRLLLRPIKAAAPAPATPPRNASGRWQGEGTILVVDDDPTVRAVTTRMVEACGFKVLQAVDGLHGVEVFSENQDKIQAVVLDMTMPKLNGREALEQMRRIRPEIKVLLVSGFCDQGGANDPSSNNNPNAFLQKPYKPDELNAKLKFLFTEETAAPLNTNGGGSGLGRSTATPAGPGSSATSRMACAI